jgi:hypothetical protein
MCSFFNNRVNHPRQLAEVLQGTAKLFAGYLIVHFMPVCSRTRTRNIKALPDNTSIAAGEYANSSIRRLAARQTHGRCRNADSLSAVRCATVVIQSRSDDFDVAGTRGDPV